MAINSGLNFSVGGLPPPTNLSTGANSIINSAIPGVNNLTSAATSNVQNLLSGMPSTSAARKANAVFGVGSGLAPGSDFLKTRLYDTYGAQVDKRNQQGLEDLLSMISGYTSPMLAERGQNNQVNQFNQSLAQQRAEFAAQLAMRQQQQNLELQRFGFDRERYLSGSSKPSGSTAPKPNVSIGWGLDPVGGY